MTGPTAPTEAQPRRPTDHRRRAVGATSIVVGASSLVLAIAAPAVADAVPLLPSSSSWLFTVTQALFLLALATNWATVAAVLGRLDLGHAVFVGIGAYAAGGMLIAGDAPPLAAVVAAGVAAAALGALVGSATLRLTPHLFAVVSFALLIVVREAVRLAEPVTRGAQGLALPPELSPLGLYRSSLVVVAASTVLAWWLRARRRSGAGDLGDADGLVRRVGVYTAVATSTGLVGALWAIQRLFIDPNNAFQALRSLDMALAAVVGGMGSITGPLVGATALFTAREVTPVAAASWQPVLELTVLVIFVLARPEGLVRGPLPVGERLLGVAVGAAPPRRPFRSVARRSQGVGAPASGQRAKRSDRVDR